MTFWGTRRRASRSTQTIRFPVREELPAELQLPADRPVVDVEAVELAQRLLEERDELRGQIELALDELSRSPLAVGRRPKDLVKTVERLVTALRGSMRECDEARTKVLGARLHLDRLSADNLRLTEQVAALRSRASSDDAECLRRQAEQDRRNALAMEDRLARAEGRPPASTLTGRSW